MMAQLRPHHQPAFIESHRNKPIWIRGTLSVFARNIGHVFLIVSFFVHLKMKFFRSWDGTSPRQVNSYCRSIIALFPRECAFSGPCVFVWLSLNALKFIWSKALSKPFCCRDWYCSTQMIAITFWIPDITIKFAENSECLNHHDLNAILDFWILICALACCVIDFTPSGNVSPALIILGSDYFAFDFLSSSVGESKPRWGTHCKFKWSWFAHDNVNLCII